MILFLLKDTAQGCKGANNITTCRSRELAMDQAMGCVREEKGHKRAGDVEKEADGLKERKLGNATGGEVGVCMYVIEKPDSYHRYPGKMLCVAGMRIPPYWHRKFWRSDQERGIKNPAPLTSPNSPQISHIHG